MFNPITEAFAGQYDVIFFLERIDIVPNFFYVVVVEESR
jgi:hypothetical protein